MYFPGAAAKVFIPASERKNGVRDYSKWLNFFY